MSLFKRETEGYYKPQQI